MMHTQALTHRLTHTHIHTQAHRHTHTHTNTHTPLSFSAPSSLILCPSRSLTAHRSGVFKAINSTVDGILSLGEILDLASRLELFLTEEEGSRIFALMDIDSDEKVSRHPVVDITWSMDITWSISENHGFRIRFETQIRGFHPLAHVMSVAHILFTSGHHPQHSIAAAFCQ